MSDYRQKDSTDLRVLFCFGITQSFFEQDPSDLTTLIQGITEAFSDLKGVSVSTFSGWTTTG